MSEPSKDISHVPTLSSDNYSTWQRKMNAYFRFNDLWGIVHGQEVRPSDAAAQPDWDKRAMRASGAIEMTLDDKNSTHVEGIEGDPVQMWQKLDSIHNNKTPGTRFNAMDILFNIRKEEDETLNGLITRVKAAMSRVKSLRPVSAGQPTNTTTTTTPSITITTSTGNVSPVVQGSQAYTLAMLDDELVIMSLLRALPEDYKHLRSALLIQKSLTLQAVEDAFIAEDGQRQHAARDGTGAGATALKAFTPSHSSHSHSSHKTSASSKPKGDKKCFFCDIPGHVEAECKQKKWAREKILKRHAEKANTADDTKSTTESHEEFAESASTLSLPPEARSDLNADTGATRIMMGNESFFSSLRPLVRTIRVANGASIQSKGEGEVVFQPWVNGDFSTNLIVFPNVLFAPNLQSNLVSVLSLVRKQSYEVRINKKQMEFYRKGILCMTARIDDNCVAHLDGRVVSAEAANTASTYPLDRELWHRRLAHINHTNLDILIHHNLLRDLQINSRTKPDPICVPCISGKQTRAIHTTSSPRSTTLLDRVSTDLHGPIHTEALPSRARYWMPFVDEASGYVFVSLLRAKDGAFEAFQRYKALAENQTNHRIKHLRDDKGGEFVSDKFKNFCDGAGIMREHTIRATPEQNGRVERVNRWISEGATAKLVEANLPPSFWGFAVLACVHEMNRARVIDNKTPYERWFGQKPSVKRLRVFGCAAFVHVQKDQRRALESHTRKCIFVGYPSDRAGWMFWDLAARKLIYSDSAIFDERDFPGTKQPKESTPDLISNVELPNADASEPRNDLPQPIPPVPGAPAPILPPEGAPMHPPILVAGQPVYHPVPDPEPFDHPAPNDEPAPADPAPPAAPPARQRTRPMSRELRGLLDMSNFEKRPGNVSGRRPSTARMPGALQLPETDSESEEEEEETALSAAVEFQVPKSAAPSAPRKWKLPLRKPPPDPQQPDFIYIPIVDGIECALNTSVAIEPNTLAEALRRPDGDKYLASAVEEIKAHLENGTWKLARLPEGKRAIGSRWVFKIKRNSDGSINKYKGRIVAKGYAQREGIDYTETFAPTARFGALRTVIALAALEDWELESVDISTAFLNGDIDAEVYMQKPEGVEFPGFEGSEWVLQLLKGLYGIKQGPRIWSVKLHTALTEIGFKRLESDHSVFIYDRDGVKIVVPVHVDDLVLASASKNAIKEVKDQLRARFKIHDQGPTSFLLGVKLERDRAQRKISLSQPAYIKSILESYRMLECNPSATPMSEKARLSNSMSPVSIEDKEEMRKIPYREALGKLLYLSIATRPDISYAVGVLCRFSENPGKEHWTALKRVLRYLRGTINYKLTYEPSTTSDELFVTHSDADLGGNVDNSRSTAGFVLSVGGGAVQWSSRLQRHTSLSSTESEYTTASATGCEIIWMREFLDELGYDTTNPSLLYIDSNSALLVAKNPEHQSTMKHVNRSYHWIREKVADGEIKVIHVPGTDNPADIFTKPLGRIKFTRFRTMLGLAP